MTPKRRMLPAVPAILVTLALVLTACGGDDAAATSTTEPAPGSSSTTTTTTLPTTTTSTAPATTTTTTMPGPTTTTLAGEPIDIGPAAGDELNVVAIAHDDVLNLRAGPGTDQEVLRKMASGARVTANGRAQLLPASIWYEVTFDGTTGWASSAFLAYIGGTSDSTAAIVDRLGEVPFAETMLDLGLIVAEAEASDDPPSRIRMSVAPTVGDLGEVTFDVVGLGDDALFGLRLHVFGQPDESGEGFSLKSVESTALCGRGVTGSGLCV